MSKKVFRNAILNLVLLAVVFGCSSGGGGSGPPPIQSGPTPGDFTPLPNNGQANSYSIGESTSSYFQFEAIQDVTYAVELISTSGDADIAAFSGIEVDETNVIVYSINNNSYRKIGYRYISR